MSNNQRRSIKFAVTLDVDHPAFSRFAALEPGRPRAKEARDLLSLAITSGAKWGVTFIQDRGVPDSTVQQPPSSESEMNHSNPKKVTTPESALRTLAKNIGVGGKS